MLFSGVKSVKLFLLQLNLAFAVDLCWLCEEGWLESLPSSPLAAPPLPTKCFISLRWGWGVLCYFWLMTLPFQLNLLPYISPCNIIQHNHPVWRYYHCAMILDTIIVKIIRTYLSGIWGKSIRLTWIIAELTLRYNLLPLGAYMNTLNSQKSIM